MIISLEEKRAEGLGNAVIANAVIDSLIEITQEINAVMKYAKEVNRSDLAAALSETDRKGVIKLLQIHADNLNGIATGIETAQPSAYRYTPKERDLMNNVFRNFDTGQDYIVNRCLREVVETWPQGEP